VAPPPCGKLLLSGTKTKPGGYGVDWIFKKEAPKDKQSEVGGGLMLDPD